MSPSASEIQVDVWVVNVSTTAPTERLLSLLTEEECVRSAAFRFEEHRREFVSARALLRTIVAGYCQLDPRDVALSCTPTGKLVLKDGSKRRLEFSISHSGGLVAVAITDDSHRVGIDIEYGGRSIAVESLMHVLTSDERNAVTAARACDRNEAFLRFWTRKEAFCKATGSGLTSWLADVDVLGDTVRLLTLKCASFGADTWYIRELPMPPGFIAALVAEAPPRVSIRSSSEIMGL